MPPPSPRERQQQQRRTVSAKRWVKESGSSERTMIQIPAGMGILKIGYQAYNLDFMPFTAGAHNQMAQPGELYFESTFWAHFGIGPSNGAYICPAMTWNEPCPVCEERKALFDTGDADDKKRAINLKPKKRQLWCVVDADNRRKGLQLMEVADYCFGDVLRKKLDNCDPKDSDRYNAFADPVDGSTLRVVFTKDTMEGGRSFAMASDIEIRPRQFKYSDAFLNTVPCLDDLLVRVEYDKLRQIFYGSSALEKPPDADGNIPPGHHDDPMGMGAPVDMGTNGTAPADMGGAPEGMGDPGAGYEAPVDAPPEPESPTPDAGGGESIELAIGMAVMHDTHGECEIVHISRAGDKVTIEDTEKNEHTCTPDELQVLTPAEDLPPEPEPAPPPKPAARPAAPKAAAAKPAAAKPPAAAPAKPPARPAAARAAAPKKK